MSGAATGFPPKLRTFHHAAYPAERIAAEREASVAVCLPARECAATVGAIVRALCELREAGALDEIVVIDAASVDGTAEIAAGAGARVLQEADLLAASGPVLGKGDAMWRSLAAVEADVICFLDADTEGFSAHFATGVLGPLLCEPGVDFVKAFYRRPLASGTDAPGEGGGRVNHLTARPALATFYPQLAEVRQPLAGEIAARRDLLTSLPFATGYGVEIAMLIDVWRAVGLGRMAQVDLDEHRNPHQSLAALTPMAATVLATIARRLEGDGRLTAGGAGGVGGARGVAGVASVGGVAGVGGEVQAAGRGAPLERPPMATLIEDSLQAAGRASVTAEGT